MDRKINYFKIPLAFLRVILCILCFALLLVAFVGGVLRYSLFDRNFYRNNIADETYCKKITEFIREDAELDCNIYQLPFSVVEPQLGYDKISEQCQVYIDAFYDSLYSGESSITVDFPEDGLYSAVYDYFIEDGIEHERAADDAAYISAELAKRAEENICAITEQKFITFLSEKVFSAEILHKLADVFFWAAGAAAVSIALLLLFGARKFAVRLYVTGGVIFMASSVVFVPVWLLRIYDLPSKLVLAASPLKSLFEGFWYSLVNRMFYISLAGFVISVIALVAAIAYIIYKKCRTAKTEEKPEEEPEAEADEADNDDNNEEENEISCEQ